MGEGEATGGIGGGGGAGGGINVPSGGFVRDPGFVDPAGGTSGAAYAAGVLTFTMLDGGLHTFFFANRAASARQTLSITVAVSLGTQFGAAGVGYSSTHALFAADISSNGSPSYSTSDGWVT